MMIRLPKIYTFLCCLAAIIGCQRYMGGVHLYACLIPYTLAVLYFKNDKLRNSFLILSLFLCVDNGDAFTSLTHSLVRYPIYLTSFFALVYDSVYSRKRILVFSVIFPIPLVLALLNFAQIDFGVLIRDLELSLLAAAIICRAEKANSFSLDMKLLSMVLLVFVCAEFINVIVNNSFSTERYLNYSSSKSLIVLPAFYMMRNNKIIQFVGVFLVTSLVLIPYGTRMIILTFVGACLVGIFRAKWISPIFVAGVIVFLTTVYLLLEAYNIELEGFKATGVFIQLLGEGNILDKVRLMDPVRYEETDLFFSRNFFRILIGDGFGAGLYDTHNSLFFVTESASAFSSKELNSRMFYNLHDTWIDLGLRFGLLLIILIYALIGKGMMSSSKDKAFYGKLLFVLFSCATFSFQGLLIIAFFWQHFVLLDKEQERLKLRNNSLAYQ